MRVLDTSVIIKWLIDEEDTPKALEFQKDHIDDKERIVVPELIFYEVANVLATKSSLLQKDTEDALIFLFEIELETYSLSLSEFILSLSLSYEYKITIYDACYVALSQVLRCEFITADKKLFEKIKPLANVKLL